MKYLNTKNAVVQQSIISEFISGASTHTVTKQQASKTLNQVQGLFNFMTSRGFTLIELLVVVLIIGILVAVAVPQYQFAVAKARLSVYLSILESIHQAEEEYYIVNGKYTIDPSLLDIPLPKQCTTYPPFYNEWKCGNDFLFDFGRTGSNSKGNVAINYCPRYNREYYTCEPKKSFSITHFWNHHGTKPGKKDCTVFNNSKLGARICNSLKLN